MFAASKLAKWSTDDENRFSEQARRILEVNSESRFSGWLDTNLWTVMGAETTCVAHHYVVGRENKRLGLHELFADRPVQNPFLRERNANVDNGPAGWLRLDQKRAIHQSDTFAHADQPQASLARRSFGIKAGSVI
jgi:hypothetical protein